MTVYDAFNAGVSPTASNAAYARTGPRTFIEPHYALPVAGRRGPPDK